MMMRFGSFSTTDPFSQSSETENAMRCEARKVKLEKPKNEGTSDRSQHGGQALADLPVLHVLDYDRNGRGNETAHRHDNQ